MFHRLLCTFLITSGVYLNAQCCVTCGPCGSASNDMCGFFIGAEGLYWTATNPDFIFAEESGNEHRLEYDWEVGVRGWTGFHWCGVNSRVVYNWFGLNTKHNLNAEEGSTLFPTYFDPDFGFDEASFAQGKMSFEYQTLDLLSGHALSFFDRNLWIEPYFGARGLQLLQNLQVEYEGLDFEPDMGNTTWKSKLQAVGIEGGLDVNATLLCGFGLYGTFSGSVLASRIENQLISLLDTSDSISSSDSQWIKKKKHPCIRGFSVGGGIRWAYLCPCYYLFQIRLGYEYNRWYNMPSVPSLITESNNSERLNLQGATLSAEFIF